MKRDAEHGQHGTAQQQHKAGVDHDALCAFPVAFAARHRAQRSTAQSEQIGKRGNERHKGGSTSRYLPARVPCKDFG